jgi:hypothetical protein
METISLGILFWPGAFGKPQTVLFCSHSLHGEVMALDVAAGG